MCEALLGHWKLEDGDKEKFDQYMEACGVPYITRKAAVSLKPDVVISKEGTTWSIKTESTFKTTVISFTLDIEFDETTADGRNVKTIITCINNVLKQLQKWGDKESVITRELQGDKMITDCTIGEVKCVRIYKRK